jgi:hypothetical protein
MGRIRILHWICILRPLGHEGEVEVQDIWIDLRYDYDDDRLYILVMYPVSCAYINLP